MNKCILFGLLLITIIGATESIDRLKQIDQSDFGRSIIDSLQMHMESGDPVSRFKEIIADIETMIEQEQKEADKQNAEYQDSCDTDLGEYGNDNNVLIRRLVEIQATLDSLKPQLDKKIATFTQKTAFRDELQSQLDELNAARKIEASEFKQRLDEHDYAAYVIETVKRMFTESSFLQVKDNKQVSDYLLNAVQQASLFTFKKSYSRIFKVLAQVTNTMSNSFVERIVNLCDQLLQNIEESKSLEAGAESMRIENYNAEKKLLDRNIGDLNTQISQLEAAILQLQDRTTVAKRDQSDTTERQEQKAKQLEDRSTECHEATFNYQVARKKRDDDRGIVSLIIGIFQANQREFQTYINDRKDAGDYDV